MKLRRTQARPQHETVVALIDVVFFLLVFFMVIGRMDATSPFDVTPPEASTGSDMPGGGTTISINPAGRLALDGIEMATPQLLTDLTDAFKRDATLVVRINAHRDTELGAVLPLVSKIEQIGFSDIILVVTTGAP